jgi:cellulose/xylan binding protein with CBM9 domain
MGSLFGKTKLEIKLLAVFLVFVGLFTFVRYPIGEFYVWMLSITNEVKLSSHSLEFELDGSGLQTKSKKKNRTKAKKKKKVVTDRGKPVTVNLPKTKTPLVLVTEDFPSWSDQTFSNFPALRLANGKFWNKEKTFIRMTTDGRKLYILIKLFDKFPNKAITKFSESNSSNAWQDDSIEIFLMKNQKSNFYCQYCFSVSGIGTFIYFKTTKQYYAGARGKIPDDFAAWGYDAEEFDNRFEMEITIPLSNIGISNLKPNDSFLMQIVRNYRGQKQKGSTTLHLFPSHIYADKRFGISNHDRRAFQPLKVMDADVYSALDKADSNFMKGMK